MTYLEVIVVGYALNILCLFLFSIVSAYQLQTDMIVLNKTTEIIKTKKRFLLNNNINPFRGKDFISLLPFGYGLYIVMNSFKPREVLYNFMLGEIIECDRYLNDLILKHKLYKEEDDNTSD